MIVSRQRKAVREGGKRGSACGQQHSPAMLWVQCAQQLDLNTSRLPPAAALALDSISATFACVYQKYL